ncbi:class I SAM-dependent methyltransferase [Denitromonas iodatirespirans]|uniref:Class I SAM-dependent methyltransferase n=1 Tax=Denitromonas iodatirespirans TaxID=2795389 RepID=A0A944DAK9_DENI1|nr:class I SAM-dependent methyltransferase [Denitromonas iodatirespirans]MBT0962825.1 class I SAM-dependent methyltransferase [Denitromonas iodatirespirans]
MNRVPGTAGYDSAPQGFIACCQALRFDEACREFVRFLPHAPARVLDVGAGAGQNAAALAALGHVVTAVEPMAVFLDAARATYAALPITWLADSLPVLDGLRPEAGRFDFILVAAVWHHLDAAERKCAMARLAHLLDRGGHCALTLRNGPPGLGSRVYATDAAETVRQAEEVGLSCVLRLDNQPSRLGHKEGVRWARLVLQQA